MNPPAPSTFLPIFFVIVLACVICVAYGIFQIVRYLVTHRRNVRETDLEFDKLRARLDQNASTQLSFDGNAAADANEAEPALQGQELLQTEEGQQAKALLRVAAIVAMEDRFWVRQLGQVYIFTKSPDTNRAPAWLVRVDTEKVEAVPAGMPVDAVADRMNSANSQQK